MSAPSSSDTSGIWDFALTFYALPDVERDFLRAQNEFGLDINTLIFALYRARHHRGFDADTARALAQSVSVQVTEPLRAVRVALKVPPAFLDAVRAETLRQNVKAAELEGERLTLDALDRLPAEGPVLDSESALHAMAQLKIHPQRAGLEPLLKRLAKAAQSM